MKRRSFFGVVVGAISGFLHGRPAAPLVAFPLFTPSLEAEWKRLTSDPSVWKGMRIMLLPTTTENATIDLIQYTSKNKARLEAGQAAASQDDQRGTPAPEPVLPHPERS
jgi:hypothetical protein